MRPRRILTGSESAEIIDQAVQENALAVLTLQDARQWRVFKSRFLERDPQRRFFVLDSQEIDRSAGTPPAPGQYVGVSFRHRSRKIMFATVIEARGRFVIDPQSSVPALRYRWPETMTELQRRAYYRTPVPAAQRLSVRAWAGGLAQLRAVAELALAPLHGTLVDLSCGGALVRLTGPAPSWTEGQTLGLELHLGDDQPAVVLDAIFRGMRQPASDCGPTAPASGPANPSECLAAVQFVGLELSPDGRAVLGRLAACVQRLHRLALAELLRGRGLSRLTRPG